MWTYTLFRINAKARRSQQIRVGWELLRPGGHKKVGAGGKRRHGARGTGALQHGGGDKEIWGSNQEDFG